MPMRLLLAAVIGALLILPASAQEKESRTIFFDGMDVFCHLMHREGVTPITSIDAAVSDPKQSVIIVFGDPRGLAGVKLKRFLDAGGNVLIATDDALRLPEFLVEIDDTRVIQEVKNTYRQSPQCPWLNCALPNVLDNEARDHPLFHFLHKGIATNCPSSIAFLRDGSPLRALLAFPFDVHDGRAAPLFDRSYIVGSPKDAPPAGRTLIIAGHGMFMNGMMAQLDNDNAAFALNAIRWLGETADGKTLRNVLFIVDGEIITGFDKKLTFPPPTIPMPTTQMINRLIRGLEDERVFHRILDEIIGDRRGRLIGILIALTTFVLLIYGAKKFTEGRHVLETTAPNKVGPMAPRVEQGGQAVFRQTEHGKAARYLAHEWFRAELNIELSRWGDGFTPQFRIGGFLDSRGRLRRQIDYVAYLASAAEPIAVSHREFRALIAMLPRLSHAVKAGRLALLADEKEVRQSHGDQ